MYDHPDAPCQACARAGQQCGSKGHTQTRTPPTNPYRHTSSYQANGMSPPHGGAVNVGAPTTSRIAPARSRLLSQVVLNIEQHYPDRASDWQFVNEQLQIYIQNQMRRFSQQPSVDVGSQVLLLGGTSLPPRPSPDSAMPSPHLRSPSSGPNSQYSFEPPYPTTSQQDTTYHQNTALSTPFNAASPPSESLPGPHVHFRSPHQIPFAVNGVPPSPQYLDSDNSAQSPLSPLYDQSTQGLLPLF